MTTTVKREVSSRLGHTALRNSENVSWRKPMGLTLPPAEGAMTRAPLVDEDLAKVTSLPGG